MNKKISFPLAIIIIVVCAVFVGVIVAWQRGFIPEIGPGSIPSFPRSKTIIQSEFQIEPKTKSWGVVGDVVLNGFECDEYNTKGCEYVGKTVKVTGFVYKKECRLYDQCWSGSFMDVESIEIIEESERVAVATDKTDYEWGKAISYTVKNMSDHPIWFPPYLVIEKKLDDEQERGYSTFPCLGPDSVREAPQPIKIESGGEYNSSWNQIFCDDRVSKNVTATIGIYRIRFLYSDEWSIEYPKSAYSNEFTIKK